MNAPAYIYSARVLRVIDGDTYDVEVDVGFRMVARLPLRLAHVDAPERNTEAGQRVSAWVKEALGSLPAEVTVRTYKPTDKYGRYLADVIIQGVDLAQALVTRGMGKPYEGGTR